MLFKHFSQALEEIENVSSRLVITEKLAALFSLLDSEEMAFIPYLLQGRIAPAYTGIEFGMAEKSVIKAAAYALNLDHADFAKEVRKAGDVGRAIELARATFTSFEQEDLTITQVFQELENITTQTGEGSQETKSHILAHLFVKLDSLSCRFISRIPIGQLRLGASDITFLDAYSWMLTGDKSHRLVIEKAYQVRPDLGYIGSKIKREGIKGVAHVKPQVFTPILMMKPERLSSGAEIMEKLGQCMVEPKYDGLRLQIHIEKYKVGGRDKKNKAPSVEIFTRGMERATAMYPDIVEAVIKEVDCNDCILEGEALGYDYETNTFLSFQETIQRKRKHNIAETAREIPLKLMVFDLIYLNGESLLSKPLVERKQSIETLLPHQKDKKSLLQSSPTEAPQSAKQIEDLFDTFVSEGLEGIMAKKLDSVYKPGAREYSWVKLKRSYSSKVQDTIDCVVMGYDAGKGKRADFGIGAVLVGVFDPDSEQYLTLAKIGTGMTDEEWKQLKTSGEKHMAKKKPEHYAVRKEVECDFWVEPHIVLEIRCDEITKSKLHTSGWSMRFPRLERFRTDKRPQDATTLNEVTKMATRH